MVFVLVAWFAVLLLAWGGPVVLLFSERTRFLAPWLLLLAVSGTGTAYALGGTAEGGTAAVLSAPGVVAVSIYLLLCWGFRSRVRVLPHRRPDSGRTSGRSHRGFTPGEGPLQLQPPAQSPVTSPRHRAR